MGLSYDEAFSSIRFSLSEYTTRQEIDYTVEQIKEICSALSDFSLNKIPKLMVRAKIKNAIRRTRNISDKQRVGFNKGTGGFSRGSY